MQAIWTGSITWGLVTVPVRLHSANQDKRASLTLHQVHTKDGARIRYHKFCEDEDAEVPNNEIGKGVETDGRTIILDKSDMDELPLPSRHSIDVVEFVPADRIDPIAVNDNYYLAPVPPAKPYRLLAEALAEAAVVAVAKVAIRDRERLAMVRARDGLLILHTLYWPEEIKSPEFTTSDDTATISKQEHTMAERLISSMTVDEPEWIDFHDEYTDALQDLINRKAKGKGLKAPEPSDAGGKVIDLMDALEKSISRSGGDKKPSTKKSSAKKTSKKNTTKPTNKNTA